MKILAALPLIFLAACGGEVYRDQATPIVTVAELDAEQYLGTWYEIARYPNWFEEGCAGVTANYAMRDDEQIAVTNRCMQGGLGGLPKEANGIARIESPGKLTVTFTPWLPFIRGDYWVLGLRQYDIAVVGNPKGSTGWILARNPNLTPEELAWAKSVLVKNGYSLYELIIVEQRGAQ